LSLDSLLDYTDKDVEESNLEVCSSGFYLLSIATVLSVTELFTYGLLLLYVSGLLVLQLSLFAESFYEMLQFQMGSRILTFLQVG